MNDELIHAHIDQISCQKTYAVGRSIINAYSHERIFWMYMDRSTEANLGSNDAFTTVWELISWFNESKNRQKYFIWSPDSGAAFSHGWWRRPIWSWNIYEIIQLLFSRTNMAVDNADITEGWAGMAEFREGTWRIWYQLYSQSKHIPDICSFSYRYHSSVAQTT